MSITLTNRIVRASFAALLALVVAGCSESKDVSPKESAPVGNAQPTPSPAASHLGAAATAEPGPVATQVLSPAGIDLSKLPVPKGAKKFYADANGAMYVSEATVEATEKEVANLLTAEGWTPYGSVPGTLDFKKNLVRLMASISAAPAQGGKTMLTYMAEKIAVDLPALADAEGLQYSDSTKSVFFDTKTDLAGVEKFYRDVLGKSEWQATTDKPFKAGFKDELIFRNPKKDMLTLQMQEFEGKRRVLLKHMSAEEVAAEEARYQAALAQKKLESEKPLPKLKLAIPAEGAKVEKGKHRLDFEVPTGTAKVIVDGWRKTLTADGWKEEVTKLDDKIGSIVFRKEKQFLSVDHIDPGFIPAEITVTATEVELEY